MFVMTEIQVKNKENDGNTRYNKYFPYKCSNLLEFANLHNDGNTIHYIHGRCEMLDKKFLGQEIKKQRRSLGYTQSEVSVATKLSRNYISDIENGRYSPSVDSLSKIAIFF